MMDIPYAYSLFGVGLGIASAFIGLAYMIGVALQRPNLVTWAKKEITEVIFIAVLSIAFLPLLTFIANNVADTLDPQRLCAVPGSIKTIPTEYYTNGVVGRPCHMYKAIMFMDDLSYESKSLTSDLVVFASIVEMVESISFDINILSVSSFGGVGSTGVIPGKIMFSPQKAITSMTAKVLDQLIDYSFNALKYIFYQKALLNFVYYSFPFLLAFGLILRLFYPTRKLGGLVMAIALSLFYVYPITFLVADAVYLNIPVSPSTGYRLNRFSLHVRGLSINGNDVVSQIKSGMSKDSFEDYLTQQDSVRSGYYQNTQNGALSLANDILDEIKEVGNFILLLLKTGWFMLKQFGVSLFTSSAGPLDKVMAMIANMMFFTLVDFYISMIVTIGSIKSLSPTLGGDVEIAGLTHLL